MNNLQAYTVALLCDDEFADLVFHFSEEEAKCFALEHGNTCHGYELEDVFASRILCVERLARRHEPYIETDTEILREAGFQHENGYDCVCCGLNDMGEERWRVCRQCNHCDRHQHQVDRCIQPHLSTDYFLDPDVEDQCHCR